MYFLGIDPGSCGALALLDQEGNLAQLVDMPYSKTEKELDTLALKELFENFINLSKGALFCVIEKCQYTPAIKGSGAFTFGKTLGSTYTSLELSGIKHERIAPQKWKKFFSLIKQDKTVSISTAKRLFPSVTDKLLKTKDGRAEALLLAEYARRCYSSLDR